MPHCYDHLHNAPTLPHTAQPALMGTARCIQGHGQFLQQVSCSRPVPVCTRHRAGCSGRAVLACAAKQSQEAASPSTTTAALANDASGSRWDNVPGLYSNEDAFSERSYWDKRFETERTFEWYRAYSSIRPIIRRHLPADSPILQLGVGTSTMQVDMAQDGYQSILNVDFSPVAVQRAAERDAAIPALRYEVADVRSMPQYIDSSFAGILDKGLMDALLCGDDAEGDAARLLREVWRLLRPGAAYVMVTSGSPRSRLLYLQRPGTPWSALQVYEVGQQQALQGPYNCGMSEPDRAVLELPHMAYSHMVYVCTR